MKSFFKALTIIAFVMVIGFSMTATAYGQNSITPAAPEPMTTKTALQYFKDENVKMGWNLGNTLDAVPNWSGLPSTWVATETAWGNPVATQALINGVKAQGFDIVRIACTWIGYIGPAPDYKVDSARLKRVAEVVNWAHNAGMKAIINIHHDGCYTEPDKGTWGFLKFAEVQKGQADNNQVKDQLTKVWTQIANYFKNYGDYLIFEVMNEVHSGDFGYGNNTKEQDMFFEWKQTALNAIRATGGNNATRFVAVPGLGASEPHIAIAAHKRGKLLPKDGANGTGKLIVAVHFYAPGEYTVVDVSQLKHTLTKAELNKIDTEAKNLKTTFCDKGIAVYYGEWGAPTNIRSNMSAEIKRTHIDYMGCVAKAAYTNGIVPIVWDDGGNFKILERSGDSPGSPRAGLSASTLFAIKPNQ